MDGPKLDEDLEKYVRNGWMSDEERWQVHGIGVAPPSSTRWRGPTSSSSPPPSNSYRRTAFSSRSRNTTSSTLSYTGLRSDRKNASGKDMGGLGVLLFLLGLLLLILVGYFFVYGGLLLLQFLLT